MKQTFFLSFLAFLCISCNQEIKKKDIQLQGFVFGTSYSIKLLNVAQSYKDEIDDLFDKINQSTSTYIADSDLSKINNGDTSVVADEILLELMRKSNRIYKETDGYFDPTVGNLVNAWGFGPKDEKRNLDSLAVKKQMQFVGFDKVKVENNQIKKQYPEIYLDFNSIGKGFGIDIIARFLDSKNIKSYMIEIGGEIRAKGVKKDGKSWRVLLENPTTNNREAFTYVKLSNKSMATSGNYRKFRVTKDGKKYVHTINPKTGFATESNLLSVSVIAAKDCADVDAYATAFMAMGLEKTKLFISKHKELEVILIYLNKYQELESYTTYSNK